MGRHRSGGIIRHVFPGQSVTAIQHVTSQFVTGLYMSRPVCDSTETDVRTDLVEGWWTNGVLDLVVFVARGCYTALPFWSTSTVISGRFPFK